VKIKNVEESKKDFIQSNSLLEVLSCSLDHSHIFKKINPIYGNSTVFWVIAKDMLL